MCSSAIELSWAWEVICPVSKDFELFSRDFKWQRSCFVNLPLLNLYLKLLVLNQNCEFGLGRSRSDPAAFTFLLCSCQDKGLKTWSRNWHRDCYALETAPKRKCVNLRLGISQQDGIKPDDDEFIQTPDTNVSSTSKTRIYEIVSWDSLNHLVQV